MAIYRLWPSTNGGAFTVDSGTNDLGMQFSVTQPGCTLTGYYIWIPVGGDTIGSSFKMQLFSTTNGTSGSLVANSTVTYSGTLTAGAWNFIALPTPPALSVGTVYTVVRTYSPAVSNSYGATASYWTTGGAGAAGITNGPITAPQASAALNSAQGSFNEPSTGGYPATASANQSNFWVDVQVTQTASGGGDQQRRRTRMLA
jgi:hypothetical protein